MICISSYLQSISITDRLLGPSYVMHLPLVLTLLHNPITMHTIRFRNMQEHDLKLDYECSYRVLFHNQCLLSRCK